MSENETTVDVDQSNLTLKELVRRHRPGDRVLLKSGDVIIGRFLFKARDAERRREHVLGLNKGLVRSIADDFDAPLSDEFWLGGDP